MTQKELAPDNYTQTTILKNGVYFGQWGGFDPVQYEMGATIFSNVSKHIAALMDYAYSGLSTMTVQKRVIPHRDMTVIRQFDFGKLAKNIMIHGFIVHRAQ